ncbi:sel1 repeat family protein [Streptomyces sp. NPDC050619]|uniref:sel1 repeat family protein n=1 Tax=Streptomyces sp. NPDC050619 TaxID=3157214 RepID=UPI0034393339
MPDIFEDLRRVGVLKRGRLGGQPSDRALSQVPDPPVSRNQVGEWLRGKHFPRRLDALLAIVRRIRIEAKAAGVLADRFDDAVRETVADLLDDGRWRSTWEAEQRRRIKADREAVIRQQAQAALEQEEQQARRAALADRVRPIRTWPPRRLGVHPAIPGHHAGHGGARFLLPRYVPRPHDAELRTCVKAAVADAAPPLLVVVRGESCTGKTRSAFEALGAVPDDFHLLFPADADGLLAALAASALGPRTVLWLDEVQDYLTNPAGEDVAAALLRRLDTDGPLIVIATLWPDHHKTLTHKPDPDEDDPHRHARKLLAQAHFIDLPRTFANNIDAVRDAADHDRSLAAAMEAGGADLTQALAAGPDLVSHYESPTGLHGVYGRALMAVAMDAHRLGAAGTLPLAFLEAAAPGYLTDNERAEADTDWFTGALAYTRTLIKRTTRPMQDVPRASGMGAQPGVVRLADYLRQYGRRTRQVLCPPASFWNAAAEHLTMASDLNHLAGAARARHRYRHAASLYCAAADAGFPDALWGLAQMRERAGDREHAERLIHGAAHAGHAEALHRLAQMRENAGDREHAERLVHRAAHAGHAEALHRLAQMRENAGDREHAERLAHRAALSGEPNVLWALARMREEAGRREDAERLTYQAAQAGHDRALGNLAQMREWAGDQEDAERLYHAAADAGDASALRNLALRRETAGDREEAERLAHQAAHAGYIHTLGNLAQMRERAGDQEDAERLYHAAAHAGDADSVGWLAQMHETAGNREDAERLAHQAAHAGHPTALEVLAQMRETAGNREDAERLAHQAAHAGHPTALVALAQMRETAGNREDAELLYRAAAGAGYAGAWWNLVWMREEAGDQETIEHLCRALPHPIPDSVGALAEEWEEAGHPEAAERLCRTAADAGYRDALWGLAHIRKEPKDTYQRYGLEPDGTLAQPWPWPEPRAAAGVP